jgi:hydroxymethylpyrimidine/phosphomethylpyrimidine kinase
VAAALAGAAIPTVWDPVLRPSRGGVTLFAGDPRAALRLLAPRLTVITPNLDELTVLSALPVDPADDASICAAAAALVRATGCAVLAKGGHGRGPEAVDWLVTADAPPLRLAAPRLDPGPTHGTGCVLSSALAAGLGRGQPLAAAAGAAKAFVSARLEAPLVVGRGARTLV